MSKVTTKEAAALTGKSRTTIWRSCKNGTISADRGDDSEFLIDRSELERVYGPLGHLRPAKPAKPLQTETSETPETTRNSPGTKALEVEVTLLRQRLEALEADKAELRTDLRAERAEREKLLRIIEEQAGSVRLLTDQRPPTERRSWLGRMFGRS